MRLPRFARTAIRSKFLHGPRNPASSKRSFALPSRVRCNAGTCRRITHVEIPYGHTSGEFGRRAPRPRRIIGQRAAIWPGADVEPTAAAFWILALANNAARAGCAAPEFAR